MVMGKCSACGCIGVHACTGKQVPMTKVGGAVFVNGIAEFVRVYCNHGKRSGVPSNASDVGDGIARYTNT